MSKNPKETIQFLVHVANVSKRWDDPMQRGEQKKNQNQVEETRQ